jgi:hypothetical protein
MPSAAPELERFFQRLERVSSADADRARGIPIYYLRDRSVNPKDTFGADWVLVNKESGEHIAALFVGGYNTMTKTSGKDVVLAALAELEITPEVLANLRDALFRIEEMRRLQSLDFAVYPPQKPEKPRKSQAAAATAKQAPRQRGTKRQVATTPAPPAQRQTNVVDLTGSDDSIYFEQSESDESDDEDRKRRDRRAAPAPAPAPEPEPIILYTPASPPRPLPAAGLEQEPHAPIDEPPVPSPVRQRPYGPVTEGPTTLAQAPPSLTGLALIALLRKKHDDVVKELDVQTIKRKEVLDHLDQERKVVIDRLDQERARADAFYVERLTKLYDDLDHYKDRLAREIAALAPPVVGTPPVAAPEPSVQFYPPQYGYEDEQAPVPYYVESGSSAMRLLTDAPKAPTSPPRFSVLQQPSSPLPKSPMAAAAAGEPEPEPIQRLESDQEVASPHPTTIEQLALEYNLDMCTKPTVTESKALLYTFTITGVREPAGAGAQPVPIRMPDKALKIFRASPSLPLDQVPIELEASQDMERDRAAHPELLRYVVRTLACSMVPMPNPSTVPACYKPIFTQFGSGVNTRLAYVLMPAARYSIMGLIQSFDPALSREEAIENARVFGGPYSVVRLNLALKSLTLQVLWQLQTLAVLRNDKFAHQDLTTAKVLVYNESVSDKLDFGQGVSFEIKDSKLRAAIADFGMAAARDEIVGGQNAPAYEDARKFLNNMQKRISMFVALVERYREEQSRSVVPSRAPSLEYTELEVPLKEYVKRIESLQFTATLAGQRAPGETVIREIIKAAPTNFFDAFKIKQ